MICIGHVIIITANREGGIPQHRTYLFGTLFNRDLLLLFVLVEIIQLCQGWNEKVLPLMMSDSCYRDRDIHNMSDITVNCKIRLHKLKI